MCVCGHVHVCVKGRKGTRATVSCKCKKTKHLLQWRGVSSALVFRLCCLRFNRLINTNEKLDCTEVAALTLTSATGHLSLLSRVQSTYSDDYIFTVRAVMRVDTYLEDPLRFAHDLYHLHIIMVGLCKRPCPTTKVGPTSLSEYLIGLQLRTIQHAPQ